MEPFTIALVQANYRSSFHERIREIRRIAAYKEEMTGEDFQHNLRLFARLAGEAASRGAGMVLSSESIVDGWCADYPTIEKAAVSTSGKEVELLAQTAERYEIWMCVGLFLREAPDIYNAAVLFDPAGRIHGIYRKTH